MKSETATPTDKPAKAARSGGHIKAQQIRAATLEAERTGRDVWLTDPAPRGAGRFMVRCTPSGSRIFALRYTLPDGSRDTLRIGSYHPEGAEGGFTLEEGRKAAAELQALYQSGIRDLRDHLDGQRKAADAARAAADRAEAEAQAQAKRGSLRALCESYAGTLKGRASEGDVRNIFQNHVITPWPALADKPAAEVTAYELRDVLARLTNPADGSEPKGRTAAKLRSYLRAAYALAMRADLDPTVPGTLAEFRIEANPADRLPALSKFSNTRDRALTLGELRAFWTRVRALPDTATADALRACLMLGGQRPTQLLRVTAAALNREDWTILIEDMKGRGRAANNKPRRHVLPVPEVLRPLLERRAALCHSHESPLFSSAGGADAVAVREESVSVLVADLCKAMAAADELERGPFRLADLRRTAETHLAALGVSKDVRAQLQSHGLGGVQDRHYDRHGYMDEKAAALVAWIDRMEGRAAEVTTLAERRTRRAAQ